MPNYTDTPAATTDGPKFRPDEGDRFLDWTQRGPFPVGQDLITRSPLEASILDVLNHPFPPPPDPPHAVRFEGEDPTTRKLTYTISTTIKRTGSGDGRGGNAHDRRKARRAGRLWRSLGDVLGQQIERARKDRNDSMNRAFWGGEAP